MSLPRAFLLIEGGTVIGSARLVCDEGGAPVFAARVREARSVVAGGGRRTPEQARAGLEFVARKGGQK